MRNFLALLGWNPGDERELFFELDDLVRAFAIERIQKKAAVFDLTKLEWMNGQYLSQTSPAELLELARDELLMRYQIDASKLDQTRLLHCLAVASERARTTNDLAYRVAVRYDARFIIREDKAGKYVAKDPEGFRANLSAALELLRGLEGASWAAEPLEAELRGLGERLGVGPGKVFQPIRVALTGSTVSEPVNVLLEVVGQAESLARMERELEGISA
jgi:glutamyl-tRNA synthetase